MNALSKALLGGAAFCALVAVPAVAENTSGFHFKALHGGRVVNKTKMPNHGATHITYTFGIYTYIPSSTALNKKFTYDVWGVCPGPIKAKIKPKKTKFGKTDLVIVSSSNCATAVAEYTVVKQPSQDDTDEFEVGVISRFKSNSTKYKQTLNLDYNIEFD